MKSVVKNYPEFRLTSGKKVQKISSFLCDEVYEGQKHGWLLSVI